MEVKNKRRTYSLDPNRSIELSRIALDISASLGKRVTKQDILDNLVSLLGDKDVYKKIVNLLK